MRAFFGLAVAAALAVLALPAGAQTNAGPWSVTMEGGVALPQNLNIKGGDSIDFDAGYRFDAGVGYQLFKPLTAQVEAGVIHNSINSIGGLAVASYGGSAALYQVPLIAELILAPPGQRIVKPFIGGGLGGVATVAQLDTPLGDVHDTDFTFCYQATAGIKLQAGDHLEFGLVYKFLGTLDHSWSQNGVTFDTEGMVTHTIMAVFTWKF